MDKQNVFFRYATLALLLTFLIGTVACSSLPKVKDFNRISVGMTKAQVIDELGEPKTTKAIDGREILVYDAEDGDELKPRWVVLEDKEVIFFGRPGEYEGKRSLASGASNSNTVTVSPTISPVISPVFTVAPTAQAPATQTQGPAERVWFHPAPGSEKGE